MKLATLLACCLAVAVTALPLPVSRADDNPYVPDEVLLAFHSSTPDSTRQAILTALGATVLYWFSGIDTYHLHIATMSTEAAIDSLSGHPALDFIEPNYYVITNNSTPDDEYFSAQWALNNTGQDGGTPDADIDAPEAWGLFTSATAETVAIIDDGADADHLDLQDSYVGGYNYSCYPDTNANYDAEGPHGTMVAGVIGAVGNNGIGVAGVAWNASLMPIKIQNDDPVNCKPGVTKMIHAFDYAITHGASIINVSMSVSGATGSGLCRQVHRASDLGIFTVMSAANDSVNLDTSTKMIYPQKCDYDSTDLVLRVAASNRKDRRQKKSNWGPNTVELAAPGFMEMTTAVGGGYGLFSYTSCAAPMVTGALALIKANNPWLTPLECKAQLLNNVDLLPGWEDTVMSGGRLNLYRALAVRETLEQPIGREIVMTHVPTLIEWTQNHAAPLDTLIDTVTIVLSKDGGASFADTLITDTANDGSYSWTPTVGQMTTTAKLKLISHNTHSTGKGIDVSDSSFVIEEFTLTEQIVSPNGGEQVVTVVPTSVQWTQNYVAPENTQVDWVGLVLSKDGGLTYPDTLAWEIANDGEYAWAPSADDVTTAARLKIVCHNELSEGLGEDCSDTTFVIKEFTLTEDIVSPNGGEQLVTVVPTAIQWTQNHAALEDTLVDWIGLVLSKDGGLTYPDTLAWEIANSGEYEWAPTVADTTSSARLKIVCHNELSEGLGEDRSDTTFSIEAWPVTYENMSSSTGLDYEGSPYSSVTLDYDNNGKNDLFLSIRDDIGKLFWQRGMSTSGVPEFDDMTEAHIPNLASRPQAGLRGMAVADYDNDGHVDVFAAADTLARLYHNNGGTFADSASVRGLSSLSSHSWAGAWGDYDRDGQVDLYVCRAQGTTQDPTPTNVTALKGCLLRNDMRTNRIFVDVTDSSGIGATAMNAAITASWADIDGDNDLDLFVGDLRSYGASPICRLYVNDDDGTFQEVLAGRFTGTDLQGISSVAWSDMNNDGNLDLVLGGHLQDPMVFLNDGTGDFDGDDPLTAEIDGEVNGVRPVDHDLDSRVDLIVLPREETGHPHLLSNRVPTQDIELLDESYQVGLAASSGRVDGIAAADFNHDGDKDIYLGRPVVSEKYFYRAKTSSGDAPTADWVGARLIAGPGNNASAIGAKVKFTIGTTFQQLQVVDGGSGRGGQADSTLICGLGALTGTVQAVVKWPGGYEQTVTLTRNQLTVITDATVPTITSGSVSATYTAYPGGTADWAFTWDTSYSCKPSLDRVRIWDRSNPPQCESLGSSQNPLVLTPVNVVHTVAAKQGGGYRHTMMWQGVYCNAPCSYNYTVESATDSSHKSTSTTRQISVGVCIE